MDINIEHTPGDIPIAECFNDEELGGPASRACNNLEDEDIEEIDTEVP